MQGFRRVAGRFRPIRAAAGRLPSKVLGLHLERDGLELRLWDPAASRWLRTNDERIAEGFERAEAECSRADALALENERQRREIEVLRARVRDDA